MSDEIGDIVSSLEVREEARALTNVDYDLYFESRFNEYLHHKDNPVKQNKLIREMEEGLVKMLDLGYSRECIKFYSKIYHAVIRHDMRMKNE